MFKKIIQNLLLNSRSKNFNLVNSSIEQSTFIASNSEIHYSQISNDCRIERNTFISKSTLNSFVKIGWESYIYNSEINSYTYSSIRLSVSNTTIGRYCSIGQDVIIGGGIHPTYLISTSPIFYQTKNPLRLNFPITREIPNFKSTKIGNDVWIGAKCIIMDGVTIGDGAIIGSGSIVTKDVEPYSINFGNPSKFYRFRFEKDIIQELMEIAWWNYSVEDLERFNFDFSKEINSINDLNNLKVKLINENN